MTHLDAIEVAYQRRVVDSTNYQGQSHLAYIYKMNFTDPSIANLPSERYLDITIRGGEYYQVQPEYLSRLQENQPVTPRKQPHTFQSFTDILLDVFHSIEELAQHDGSDPSLPLWISINGNLFEYNGLPPNDHPDYEFQKRTHAFLETRLGGREVVQVMAKNLYEPLYLLSSNKEDLCEEQRAQIEDEFYSRIGSDQNKKYWKAIGRLRISNSFL